MTAQPARVAPEGFSTVVPMISVVDLDRLVAFSKEVFGATEVARTGHPLAILQIGDSKMMLFGGVPNRESQGLNALHVYVPDTDAVYQRALRAGAESLYEPGDRPYGERNAGVKDFAGNYWYIATRTAPAPPMKGTMGTVTPFLLAKDALGLLEFLKSAFNGIEEGVFKSPDGKLMHALLWIGDAALEFGESDPLPFAFYLYSADVDASFKQAVDAGAKPVVSPADQPYGDRLGVVEDPWGNRWCIATPRSEPRP